MKGFFTLLVLTILTADSQAQLAAWDFTGENQAITSTAESVHAGIVSAPLLSRGANATSSTGANSFRTTGFKNDGIALSNTDYFEFSFTVKAGYTCSIADISGKFVGTTTYYAAPGVSSQMAYSINGASFQLIGSQQISLAADLDHFKCSVSNISTLQNIVSGTIITFRYYASGQTTTGGWGFGGVDGLVVNGTADVMAGTGNNTTNHAPSIDVPSDVTICYNNAALSIPLTGIAANDVGQNITISVITNNAELFELLNVVHSGGGNGVLNYKFKTNVNGEATVFIKVKDDGGVSNGGVDSIIRSFKIIETTQPSVDEHAIFACVGMEKFLIMKGLSGQAPYTFTYSVNQGASLSTTTTGTNDTARIAVNTRQSGQYIYKLIRMTNATCQVDMNDSVTVVVLLPVVAAITGPADVCSNASQQQITITATEGKAPFTFFYTVNNGEIQSIQANASDREVSFSLPTNVAGVFQYKLVKVDDYFGSFTRNDAITVTVREPLSGTISGDAAVGISEDNLPIEFTVTGGVAPYSFYYTINNGQEQILRTDYKSVKIDASVLKAGNFTYRLEKISDRSCTVLVGREALIAVHSLPDAVISPSAVACINGPPLDVLFTAIRGAPPYIFRYRVNQDNEISITTNQSILRVAVPNETPGSFIYTLTEIKDAFGKHTLNDSAIFTIQTRPNITILTSRKDPINKGEIVTLTAHGYDSNLTYIWNGSNILTARQDSTIKVRPDSSATYRLIVTNAAGCEADYSMYVPVQDTYSIVPTNILTPNNDGKNDLWVIPGIEKYPNNYVRLFNSTGRMIFSEKGYKNTWDGRINGVPLAEGTYFYSLDLGSHRIKGFITVIQ